jgi:TRAP-type C4-dicarboxylate transport system permease small subunit
MEKSPDPTVFGRIIRLLHRVEDAVLVSLLLLMIGLASAQIVSRNLFDAGFVWGDVLLRILVLWVGLMGAMAATRENHHINIDIITRHLPASVKHVADGVVAVFTAAICGVVTWYSVRFVQMEMEYSQNAFAQVPTWVCEIIIPAGFGVMALRFLFISFSRFSRLIKPAS